MGTTKCGWCITGHHDSCKPSITYFDKVWHCDCDHPKVAVPTKPRTVKIKRRKTKPIDIENLDMAALDAQAEQEAARLATKVRKATNT